MYKYTLSIIAKYFKLDQHERAITFAVYNKKKTNPKIKVN